MNEVESYVCFENNKVYIRTTNFKLDDPFYYAEIPEGITKDKWAYLKIDNGEVVLDQTAYDAYQAQISQQAIDQVEKDAINLEIYKMEIGKQILALIGYLFNSLSQSDYEAMLSDHNFLLIQNLLRQGAVNTSRQMIYDTPVNSYLTQSVKDKVIAKLDDFIATLP